MRFDHAAISALALSGVAHAATSDSTPADSLSFVERASAHLAHAHGVALRHSAAFARDLRTTFRAVLPPRTTRSSSLQARDDTAQKVLDKGHKLYCAAPKSGFSSSGSGNGTNSGNGDGSSSSAHSTGTAKGATSTRTSGASSTGTQAAATATSSWKAVHSYSGNDFFNDWDFFTGADPTNGAVIFLSSSDAQAANLSYLNSDGNFIMAVETTTKVDSTRKSVRITTKDQYNGGLVIMDAAHMPTGCGTWPAFWSNGPNWPAGGEIDIVEGVSDYIANQATIHTDPGCTLSSSDSNTLGMSGQLVGGQDCAAASTGNQGCGVRSPDLKSFGAAFNANGGGVYAMKWDTDGISVYFFQPDAVPSDIAAGAPKPEGWGLPMAHWPASGCDPFKYFSDHHAIFDTTLCGDWAEGVWGSSGIPGQEQSCAQRTGAATCVDFIRANGQAMAEAYWEVRSVKIYQTS